MAVEETNAGARAGYRDEDGLTPAQRTWLEHIRRCEAESLSYKAYCNREGLAVRGLYGARKALRKKGVLERGTARVPTSPPRFAAVRLAQPGGSVTADALLPNGVQLRVSCEAVVDVAEVVRALARL